MVGYNKRKVPALFEIVSAYVVDASVLDRDTTFLFGVKFYHSRANSY